MNPQEPNIPPADFNEPSIPKAPQAKENSSVSTLAVAIFILLAIGAVVFLYYQNQQLRKMLANYQTQPTVTASPEPSATADPTANWKTYPSSSTIGLPFTFKYPETVVESESQDLVYLKTGDSTLFFRFVGKTKNIAALMSNYQPFASPKVTFSTKTAVTIGDLNGYKALSVNNGSDGESNTYFFLGNDSLNGVLVFDYPTADTTSENLLNQILPTFKFIVSATTTPAGPSVPGTSCLYQGETYQNGDSVPSGDDCNTCSCESGQVACTTMACQQSKL